MVRDAISASIKMFRFMANNRTNNVVTKKEMLMVKHVGVVELNAKNGYLNQFAKVRETFQ